MSRDAVLLVRVGNSPCQGVGGLREINHWRCDLLSQFEPGKFWVHGPLTVIPNEKIDFISNSHPGYWLDVGILETYYGRGYERGDIEYIVTLSRWLEHRIPESQIWYGHDMTLEALLLFNEEERTSILEYHYDFERTQIQDRSLSTDSPPPQNP